MLFCWLGLWKLGSNIALRYVNKNRILSAGIGIAPVASLNCAKIQP